MKRQFFFLILFFCLVQWACNRGQLRNQPPIIASYSHLIDIQDPQDSAFPGGRGSDQLLVYSPAFGARTGTNIYGIEARIEHNVVTSVGDNNSLIPSNGLVVSGHGKASRWISEHLAPGVAVRLAEDSLIASITVESRLIYAEGLLSKAQQQVDSLGPQANIALDSMIRFSHQSKESITKARTAYQAGEAKKSIQLCEEALQVAKQAYHCSFPARSQEVRAVWLAMQEDSPEALAQTIAAVAEAGFNTICPQVIFAGYAIYPGAPDLDQHPKFRGWDPMKELVKLSQTYQLKLAPWVWVYFVGKEGSPLITSKANWLAISRQGVHPSEMEVGYHFFCPSRPEVRAFWKAQYQHLLTTYQVDGLQLDYIRYPVSLPWDKGYCYCEHCRQDFQQAHGSDPMDMDPVQDSLQWKVWSEYRRSQISTFVEETHNWITAIQPGIRLSADIFPDIELTRESKLQDWGKWLREGWLEDLYTMTYTPDLGEVWETTRELTQLISPDQKGIVGLAPFMGLSAETLLEEIQLARVAGADGLCFFHFGSFTPEHFEALKRGPFRPEEGK